MDRLTQSPSPTDEHGRAVSSMFGRIARWYDFLNRFLSAGQDQRWRRELASQAWIGSTRRVLDLAAGTLDVTRELTRQHPDVKVIAADFSLPMLVQGKHKLNADSGSRTQLALADGRALPLPEASVDSVTIAFGVRNITPRSVAFAEMYRVLAPGGVVCILEFGSGKTRIWRGLYNLYLRWALPALGRIFSGDKAAYTYLADTITAFPGPRELAEEMEAEGFTEVRYRSMTSGIVYLHVGRKPQT